MGRLHKFYKLQGNFLFSIDPKKCDSCHLLFVCFVLKIVETTYICNYIMP